MAENSDVRSRDGAEPAVACAGQVRRPDPASVLTAPVFMAELRALRIAAGNPSLRDLERTTGLPRSTIAKFLDRRRVHLPPMDRTMLLLAAFSVTESERREWAQAWTRIQLAASESASGPAPGLGIGDEGEAAVLESENAPHTGPAAQWRRTTWKVGARFRDLLRQAPVTLCIGVVIGSVLTLLVAQGLGRPVRQPVPLSDDPGCPSAASGSPVPQGGPVTGTPEAGGGKRPEWIARPASDAQILTATGVELPVIQPVPDGDALVVTLMLTAACPGVVVVTDSQGNRFRTVADVTDSLRHRVMMLAAFHVRSLTTVDVIHVSYPQSSKYHVAVDEFRGISGAVRHAEASGNSGGSAFTTSMDRAMACTEGQLVVAAVGTNTGTAPSFVEGWTTIGVLKLSSYRLTTGYRLADRSGACAATGTTTAQWGAVIAVFQ